MTKHLVRAILPALVAAPLPLAAAAQEKLPPGAKVVRLEARPAAVHLKQPFDYAQLLVSARLETGELIDATRLAQLDRPAALVKVSPAGLVRPAADGQGEIRASL